MGVATNQIARIKDLVPRGYVKLFDITDGNYPIYSIEAQNECVTYKNILDNHSSAISNIELTGTQLISVGSTFSPTEDGTELNILEYKLNESINGDVRFNIGSNNYYSITVQNQIKYTNTGNNPRAVLIFRLYNPITGSTHTLSTTTIDLTNTDTKLITISSSYITSSVFKNTDVLYLQAYCYTSGIENTTIKFTYFYGSSNITYLNLYKTVKYSEFSTKSHKLPWDVSIYNDRSAFTSVNTVEIGYIYRTSSSDSYTANYNSQKYTSGNDIGAGSHIGSIIYVEANPIKYQGTVPNHACMIIRCGTSVAKLGYWLYLRNRLTQTWSGPYKASNYVDSAGLTTATFSDLITMTGLAANTNSEWNTTNFPCTDGNKNFLFTLYKYDAARIVLTKNYNTTPSSSVQP